MGTLVTLHLPPGSPLAGLPWVVTIGSLGDQEGWDPLVCGPYEREHALALARAVVIDDDLMAVVEPMLALDGVAAIRKEIEQVRATALDDGDDTVAEPITSSGAAVGDPPEPAEVRAAWRRMATRLAG
ncbi:hypothetical protein [Actinoplanes sp. GCM10030250]|uniref:hypothetical protein n=1 Tax=Actinoplanes sp. GCM10030250 TaxID=3273376 RepID=UPI00361414E2